LINQSEKKKEMRGRRQKEEKKERDIVAVVATCERRGEKIYCRIMRGMLLNASYYNISIW